MLPWRAIAKYRQLKVKYINVTPDGDIDYEDLAHKLSPRTKVVAITHVSNTLGTIVDIKKVVKLAKEEDAVVFLDAAQSVPHLPVNFRELGVDAAAFSGHKMLGPAGTGGLYVKRDFLDELEPIKSGGDAIRDVTIDDVSWNILPWKFAPGTPNLEGFIGLAEAVRYLKKIGMESVRQHDKYLLSYTIKKAIDELGDKIIIYGPKDVEKRSGAFTFNIRNTSPNVIGLYLDMHGIAVRTGMHCTHPLHYDLSMMSGKRFGTVRASFYIYNTKEEADTLIEALKKFEGA
jgi:cysteine desulfurase/selenocysteine lyase